MLRIKLLALCACMHFIAVAQNISGIINTYHKVTALTNTNAESSVQVDNVTGLKILDKVMIIQMKGAKVDESNDNNFGKLTSTKPKSEVGIYNAGNYEIALICRIQGNKVFFINKILKTYDTAGKVQLVKIPKYSDAVVAGSIEAAPWDSASGKGGVLAISVAGTLTLNGKITADGRGFKGGKFLMSDELRWPCTIGDNYAYDPTQLNPQWGAYKGESVAAISLSKSGGRGALANGGGGGNNHNTGGGGGANAGAGGGGGANAGGSCITSYYGIGGYSLSAYETRLFLGGGGGAGHGNNTSQTGGGNGGGIIFIEAKTLVGNGYDITSNGQNGSNTIGDGGSGGGGGGSIIMNVTTFTGAVAIAAKGGNGGKADHDVSGYCFDGGGGGGGGIVYFKGVAPAGVSVVGGAKGGRSGIFSCSGEGTSQNGGIGLVVPGFSLDAPGPVSASCPEATALPVGLITFEAYLKENKTTLRWQIAEPKDAKQFIIQRKAGSEEWKDINTLPAQSGVATYTTTDATITEGNYQYRLQIIEQDGKVVYSPIRSVSLAASRNGQLVIYPNPATSEITIVKNTGAASRLEIFDATGKLVFQKQVGNSNVIHQDVTFLQKGLYIVKVDGTAQRLIIGQ